MKKFCLTLLILLSWVYVCISQVNIPLPQNLPQGHPRLLVKADERENLRQLIEKEEWASEVMMGIKNRIDKYVERHVIDPTWMPSRLMMYWKSKANNVYIKGGVYSHADGEAPVPTVRFGSTRGLATIYGRPQIEDIVPYMDDTKGVYFHNTKKEDHPLEWGEQANASGIESINEEIMGLGKDAAFVYWVTGDMKYAKFSFDLFDTYMMGMYYRNEPIDLNKGHNQTLVGLSTFEVIQERILNELAYLYDFVYPYIEIHHGGKLEMYAATFKKWIDITIKNGVPQNNWNLHQAKFILRVAMVLEDNESYADGRGREYYIDLILNKTSARQWSLTKFMEYGYDLGTGVWSECPGYAQGVTRDLTNFIRDYDNTFNQNLLPYLPVMREAVKVLPQYLFPNGQITAFGDTHYGGINTEAFSDMIRLAQKHGNKEDEKLFTKMYKLFEPSAGQSAAALLKLSSRITSFFINKPLELDMSNDKGVIEDYITQTFYAPNVSWFVQRSGYGDKQHGLMISQVGSLGNHAHANGVSMELYGKGYVLGAESGIGSSYFERPYLEYYSQFPAHNTVMVDGISKYPEMLSKHPFDLLSCYPESGRKDGYYHGITFSDVDFLEPESRSDQNRLLSIIRNSDTTGYYVDIFRSKKQRGGDKFHDYFYHNLGQELFIQNGKGESLDLQPSDEMGFAGGHLFALDYMWDKKSARTNEDYDVLWKMSMPNGNHIYMSLWMKGYSGREVFSIKSPPTKAFRGNHGIPYHVDKEPFLTIAARQHGEAWNHPFVSIFEPYDEEVGRSIASITGMEALGVSPDFVGVVVTNKSGRTDHIFSSTEEEKTIYNEIEVNATYAVISHHNQDFTIFIGNGVYGSTRGIAIESQNRTTFALEFKSGEYYLTCDAPVKLTVADNFPKGKAWLLANGVRMEGKRLKKDGLKNVVFELPAMNLQKVLFH